MIPAWLAASHDEAPAVPARKAHPFLVRTIREVSLFLNSVLIAGRACSADGFLSRADARVKLIALVLTVATATFLKSPTIVWGAYAAVVAIAILGKLRMKFFLTRVWLFIPLLFSFFALPSLLNIVTPGEPLLVLLHIRSDYLFGPYHVPSVIAVTKPGIMVAALFVGRSALCISLALLVTATTPWPEVLAALHSFRIPAVFVVTLSMAHKYILLLAEAMRDFHLARRSRTSSRLSIGSEQKWVASRIGALFGRAYRLGNAVHAAMVSRGFSGDLKMLRRPKLVQVQYVQIGATVLVCCFLISLDMWVR